MTLLHVAMGESRITCITHNPPPKRGETMSAADYLRLVDDEIARRLRLGESVAAEAIAEAIFARTNIEDAIAAFLERARSRERRRGAQLRRAT
jgi:hypothetical protein